MNFIKKLVKKITNADDLSFIKSEDKREVVKDFSSNWNVTKKELKALYLNRFISVKKSNVKVSKFPILFWLNGLFSSFQLIVCSVFLLACIFAPNKTLEVYLFSAFICALIGLVLFNAHQTMLRPIQILIQQYYFYGKYNNFKN
jgi:hypothetical protein